MPKYAPMTQSQRSAMNNIAAKLKKLFEGQTQTEISEKTGLVQSKISKILNYSEDDETGQLIHIPDLVAIADAYQVSLASLVERESDEKYLNATLRDALAAFEKLGRTLGYTVSEPVDGCRPAITLKYSALDDFIYLISGMTEFDRESHNPADLVKYKALSNAFNSKLRELDQYNAEVFSARGAAEGRKSLPWLYDKFGDNIFDYKHAPADIQKDMRGLAFAVVPFILSYLCDAKRRRDFAGICEAVHIEPEAAEEKTGELIGSLLALLDDVPADRKLATSEQFRHLFYE